MRQRLIEEITNILYLKDLHKYLQRIEQYFLLNRPRLWILKLHYVFCYAILVDLLIVLLVIISQPGEYQVNNYSTIGTVLLSLGEIIGISYWIHKQSLYNIEKQYGDLHRSNVYLEMLGYSLCIMLIASPMLVFNTSVAQYVKATTKIPENELTTDLLIIKSIEYNNKLIEFLALESNNNTNFIEDLNARSSNNQKCHVFIDMKLSSPRNIDKSKKEKYKSFFDEIFCNKLLSVTSLDPSDFLSSMSESEVSLLYYWVRLDIRNIYSDLEGNEDKIENFKQLLGDNINKIKSIKKDNKDQIRKEFNDKLTNYTDTNIFNIFNQTNTNNNTNTNPTNNNTNTNPTNNKKIEAKYNQIKDASENARKIYNYIYLLSFVKPILSWVLLFLSLGIFLLYSFKKTYKNDFVGALIYIIVVIATLSYLSSLLSKLNSNIEKIIFIFTLLFVFIVALGIRKNKEYWRFKTLNIIAFPVLLAICAWWIMNSIHHPKTYGYEDEFFYWLNIIITLLSYFPCLPWINRELIRQLSLPRSKL